MKANPPASDSGEATWRPASEGDRLTTSRFALFLLPLLAGLVTDLVTKAVMFRHYYNPQFPGQQQKHWWIEGIFGFQTATNPGALFGIGSGLSWLFAAFSIVALVGIVAWVFVWGGWRDRWLTFGLGLISGGILGNLYDRVGLGYTPGHPESIRTNVRDWILFELDGVRGFDPWPNFNIADAVLVTGAIMLVIHALFLQPAEASSDASPAEAK